MVGVALLPLAKLPPAVAWKPLLLMVLAISPAVTNLPASSSAGGVTLPLTTVSGVVSAATVYVVLPSAFRTSLTLIPSPAFTLVVAAALAALS